MQRCVYYSSKFNGPSPKEKCIKISIAAPTPTTVSKRFRIILTAEKGRTLGWTLSPLDVSYSYFDGYYLTSMPKSRNKYAHYLAEFLHIAKEEYQLSDYNALQLLGFFNYNSKLALFHLGVVGSEINVQLELDSPWRIEFPSIAQQIGLYAFAKRKNHRLINSRLVLSKLPKKMLFKKHANRLLRIQRAHHNGLDMWVLCVLPDKYGTFKVRAVLMPPIDVIRHNLKFKELAKDLEQYLLALVMAKKPWNVLDGVFDRNVTYHLINNLNKAIYSFLMDIATQPLLLTTLLASYGVVY